MPRSSNNIPASPSVLDDSLDIMGFGDQSTIVQQIDKGLHPDGVSFVELMVKSRVSPQTQPYIDHILSRAIQTGKFSVPVASGKKLNAAESLALAHSITQIAIRGESRAEFTKTLGGIGGAMRSPFRMFGQRRMSNYGGMQVQ